MNDPMFIAAPGLRFSTREAGIRYAINDALETELALDLQSAAALEFFAAPKRSSAFKDASIEALLPLMTRMLLVDVDMLAHRSEAQPLGQQALLSEMIERRGSAADYVLGVACDVGTTFEPGARHGPTAIRKEFSDLPSLVASTADDPNDLVIHDYEFRREYETDQLSVFDLGNLATLAGEGVKAIGERLAAVTELILQSGGRPVVLGGDHSISHWTLQSVLRHHAHLTVIHFDAHHDLMPTFSPEVRYLNHGNPFVAALQSPRLTELRQLGLRTVEAAHRSKTVRDPRLTYRSARELARLSDREVFEGIRGDMPVYLSIDIDCLNPELVTETGTPCVGGLSYYRALDLIDHAARHLNIVAYDIVEVGSHTRGTNWAASAAARLTWQLLASRLSFRPLVDRLQRA